MKKLLLLVLIIPSMVAEGQNYQCLQAGVKHYFTNGNGYLHGIRIDSVRTMGDTTVYYPFHTPRGSYYPGMPITDTLLDPNGGSWLGKKVLQKSDGTFIFDSYWNDSVIIKTQANPGDSWVFYRDTSTLYYEATMLGCDTITVLGTLDSTKIIMITAHNPSGIVTSDPLDSFKILLSKNNGFVQVMDLYTFPYHKPDSVYIQGLDFYLDRSIQSHININSHGLQPPSVSLTLSTLVDFTNPNDRQLHNWDTGDIIESCYGCDFTLYWAPLPQTYILDTIVSKSVTGTTQNYYLSGTYFHCLFPHPCMLINNARGYAFDNNAYTIADENYFPENKIYNYSIFYYPDDTSYCSLSPEYIKLPSYNSQLPSLSFVDEFTIYKLGLGEVLFNYFDEDGTAESDQLIYYKINGFSCGPTPPNEIRKLLPSFNNFSIFPNPATEELTIKTTLTQPYTITLQNMLGEKVQTLRTSSQEQLINVAALPAGVYNVSITDDVGSRYIEKVIIMH